MQWESKTKDERFVMYSSIVVGDCQLIAWDSPEAIRTSSPAPPSMYRRVALFLPPFNTVTSPVHR